jgi:hypothetical protein
MMVVEQKWKRTTTVSGHHLLKIPLNEGWYMSDEHHHLRQLHLKDDQRTAL